MLEDLSCLLATSDSSEGVDVPQRAYGEGYCRGAEVVWGGIAEDMTAIRFSTAATVPRKRGSDAATKPISCSSRRLASTSFPPKLSTKVFCSGSHALSRIVARIRVASVRQWLTRSERSRMPAILASRSQAAQHIALEKVWTRARPRNSHRLASGSNADTAGPSKTKGTSSAT